MHTYHAVHEAGTYTRNRSLTQVPVVVSLLWRMDRQFQGFFKVCAVHRWLCDRVITAA